MHEIFISYRQDDTGAWALIIRDALVASFGEQRVYLDKDTQRTGDWREQIRAGIERCKVVLVPMGPRWLGAAGPDGARRLDLPDDVHRQEIALALATPGVTVIPIRVDGAPMLRADELSEDIRGLVDQQWREVAREIVHRRVDIARLIEDVEQATGLVARRPTATSFSWRSQLRLLALGLVSTLAIVTAFDIGLGWQRLDGAETVVVFLAILVLLLAGRGLMRRFRRRG